MKHTLTVVGLGPGSKAYLTVDAVEKMKTSKKIILRTQKHPVVDYLKSLDLHFESFDKVYEEKDRFEEVYHAIVDQIFHMLEEEDILYAVPGNPFVAEETVQLLLKRGQEEGVPIEFVPAASFLDAVFYTLKKDPIQGLQILDGLQLDKQIPNGEMDVIITQVYNRMIASHVKIKLMDYYADEHPVVIIKGAGIPGVEQIIHTRLYELDRGEQFDYLTSIYIPRTDDNTVKYYTMNNLIKIMEKLRSKEGCPWDAKQTHESLRPYLIEETYEVLEAIEQKDMSLLEEELGDLLLQVVFHAQLAAETGDFHMRDVITGICKKMIYRHPHVFTKKRVNSVSDALKNWEEIKRREKDVKTYTDSMQRIPKHLPALMKSYKVQEKAAAVGFDWDHIEGAIVKVKEELTELLEVYKTTEFEKITEELGDLLFAVVNVARFLKVDPEMALNQTTQKFMNRFAFIEKAAKENGKRLEEMSLKEMDDLWNLSKTQKT